MCSYCIIKNINLRESGIDMLKLYYVIFRNLLRLPTIISTMRKMADHPEQYSEEERYAYAQYVVSLMQRTGAIRTEVYGEENLPEEGGYMMYPNHQGKYDVYGIIGVHKKPCTFVMDKAKSYIIFVREALEMLGGKRLDKEDMRQALTIINEVAEEVKKGARFILFPEGEYIFNNKNKMLDFKPGCFKIALKSKVPVVPVALIDSYKVFNSYHVGPVTTQVHYLKPIFYEEYKGMKTHQLAELVRERIQEKINEVTAVSIN